MLHNDFEHKNSHADRSMDNDQLRSSQYRYICYLRDKLDKSASRLATDANLSASTLNRFVAAIENGEQVTALSAVTINALEKQYGISYRSDGFYNVMDRELLTRITNRLISVAQEMKRAPEFGYAMYLVFDICAVAQEAQKRGKSLDDATIDAMIAAKLVG